MKPRADSTQVCGPRCTYGLAKPTGSRVVDVTVGGAAREKAKTYTLATNDFLARGSDGYSEFNGAKILIDAKPGTLMATLMINHVSGLDNIWLQIEGRITRQN